MNNLLYTFYRFAGYTPEQTREIIKQQMERNGY